MRYKLIDNSPNDINNPQKTILFNRGVDTDIKKYRNLNLDTTHDFFLLENIREAIKVFNYHIEKKSNIHIVVDCDIDGYTSASSIYKYIKLLNKDIKITYSIHTGKQHGLSSDIEIPNDCDLLIIPDAGSNDVEQCKQLKTRGIDIIILDHHEIEYPNEYAIVVNNQMGSYPNKNLSGVGVVYKFLKAYDEEFWFDYADSFLDIVALGNIGDSVDLREYETRYYVNVGIAKIRSKLLKALINKQSFYIQDSLTINSIQFYICPIINALIRIGTSIDKDLLFRAFIETDEMFKYKKRNSDEEEDETIYDRVARLCSNTKAKQDRQVTKEVELIENLIKEKKLDDNKFLFINVTGLLGETYSGLVANKIAEKYGKPTFILRKIDSKDEEVLYGGSARNFRNSPIQNLKSYVESTELFDFYQGHGNAFGVNVKRNNIMEIIEKCNQDLKDIDMEKIYLVDFTMDYDDLSITFVKDIDEMKDIFCFGIEEPSIYISNITLDVDNILVMGKTKNSWKFSSESDLISVVNFGADVENDYILNMCQKKEDGEPYDREITIDAVCKVSINNFNGLLTPQIIIKDYVVKN